MIYMGRVQGTPEQAKELVIGKEIVYVHDDIQKVTKPDERGTIPDLYEYEEWQYTKDEYINFVLEENKRNSEAIDDIVISMLEG